MEGWVAWLPLADPISLWADTALGALNVVTRHSLAWDDIP